MKLIIYLASNDPIAIRNRSTLRYSRALSGTWSRQNLQSTDIRVDNNSSLIHDDLTSLNFFNGISAAQRNKVQVELIAHVEGGYRLKSYMSEDDYNNKRPPIDITTDMLKLYFDSIALERNESEILYKFNAIPLFCCEGYRFGKALSLLMPNVEITCFNEDIIIDNMAHAYPYKKSDRIFAIDKNGREVSDHSSEHFRCPLHIFIYDGTRQLEKTIFDSVYALPDQLQNIPYTVLADNSVEIIGNFLEMPLPPQGVIHPLQPITDEANRMGNDVKVEAENDSNQASESSS
jgi:hypothetical protein